jgi:GT2 family glycosyltransferase
MDVSILIVTKNRSKELALTLSIIENYIDLSKHEVLVFIDGCKKTEAIIENYKWVNWSKTDVSLGASPARHELYKKALGTIFIGFDDDAHPLSPFFIKDVQDLFKETKNLGVIAFKEIKGVFSSDEIALKSAIEDNETYFTNDFIGCGFAISKVAYNSTNGFPLWMTIYGEETCVAIEALNNNYNILYTNTIKVNHRVDVAKRLHSGRNYFRFQHQLTNIINYYLVYYKKPIKPILKAILHNGNKYALKNTNYFKNYCKALFKVLINLPKTLKYRKPILLNRLNSFKKLKALKY